MPPRRYENGESYPYRGEFLSLEIRPDSIPQAKRTERAEARLIVSGSTPEEIRRYLLYWYTAETERIVRALLPRWSKQLGVRPKSATVRYAKTRWGSCSSSGAIYFNSRLAMLSDAVAEYVVVHELCHLKQMNHSPAFWHEVESALPGCRALRSRLRQEERNAHL